jgi:type IV pilus assembly protein PilA
MPIVRRIRRKDAGFTLVELMVVVMIIAILMAIAIPTFLNSRKRAQDSAAKSNVRNGLAAAQSVFSEDQSYPAIATMLTSLAAEEPSLQFVSTASTDPKMISVFTIPASATVVVSAQAKSGKCFSFKNVSAAGGGTTEYEAASGTTCQAAATPPTSTATTTVSSVPSGG